MKKFGLILACIIFLGNLSLLQAKEKGHLVIIGGKKSPQLMSRFVKYAGGEKAKVVIIPMASGDMLEAVLYQRYELEKLGVKDVSFIICDNVSANADSNLSKLEGVTGIFFSGGDQSRLTAALLGTKLLEKIRSIHANGGVVGGNSAGAAVMSQIMITGDEILNTDSTRAYITIQKGNIKVTEGFGFVKKAIVDQHFIRRKRHNRLISIVLENPSLFGVAIDEATAIDVYPDDTFEVIGEYTVLVWDARNAKNIVTDKNNNLSGSDIRMHLLKAGDRFDLNSGKVK